MILPMLCCTMLSGCASAVIGSEVSSEPETATQEETQSATEQTEEPATEPEQPDDPKTEIRKLRAGEPDVPIRFNFKKEGEVIGVYYKQERMCEIKPDRIPDDDTVITGMDCDFDGIEDVYISGEPRPVLMTTGDYWVCDPETLEFHISDKHGFYFGKGLEATAFTKKLETKYSESPKTECTLTLEWKEGELVPVALKKKTMRSFNIDNNIAIMHYEDNYDFDENGDPMLVSRTLLSDDTDDEYVKNELYVRVTDDAVECMRGRDVIQTIPVEGISKIAAALNGMPEVGTGPKPLIYAPIARMEDYDFDGYDDLRIVTGTDKTGAAGSFSFYRYDPSSGQYKEWPELNALPAALETDPHDEYLYYETSVFEDNTLISSIYYLSWENGRLVPVMHNDNITVFSENGEVYFTDNAGYRYDENGNEYKCTAFEYPKTVSG